MTMWHPEELSRPRGRWLACVALPALLSLCPAAPAQEPISLMVPKEARFGWTFNNGPEFPGATGTLAIETEKGTLEARSADPGPVPETRHGLADQHARCVDRARRKGV
jgi:hypothetical protein